MQTEIKQIHEAFTQLVAGLCTAPKELHVVLTEGRLPVISIIGASRDFGVLCGKEAKNIKALRVIANAMGAKQGIDAIKVRLEDPTNDDRMRREFQPNPQWQSDALEMLIMLTCAEIFDGTVRVDWVRNGAASYQLAIYAHKLRPPQKDLDKALGIVFGTIGTSQGVALTTELYES